MVSWKIVLKDFLGVIGLFREKNYTFYILKYEN
jgi:hypothetical protein